MSRSGTGVACRSDDATRPGSTRRQRMCRFFPCHHHKLQQLSVSIKTASQSLQMISRFLKFSSLSNTHHTHNHLPVPDLPHKTTNHIRIAPRSKGPQRQTCFASQVLSRHTLFAHPCLQTEEQTTTLQVLRIFAIGSYPIHVSGDEASVSLTCARATGAMAHEMSFANGRGVPGSGLGDVIVVYYTRGGWFPACLRKKFFLTY